MVINGEREKSMPKMGMQDEDSMEDSRKAKRGQETPLQRVRENTPHPRGTTQTSIPPFYSWAENINIGSRQDELDPAILVKLLVLSAIAAASVLSIGLLPL
ncbi:hypothetical protein Fot_11324 [Forsythia ovata]|uniref:Uncharacterized protein n=1 Tax=Forsythia ovata TaxID=205694 RepID=A0ABD1WJD1_9LAMI